MAKHLNVDGQISTLWPLVPNKWGQAHGETHLTTILVTEIERRLWDLVCFGCKFALSYYDIVLQEVQHSFIK